jgi:hypothetical protein
MSWVPWYIEPRFTVLAKSSSNLAVSLHVRKDLFSIENRALSTNIKLTLYKALNRSVVIYACPIWEYAVDTHLLKLQRL